jgi:hypothetical protein
LWSPAVLPAAFAHQSRHVGFIPSERFLTYTETSFWASSIRCARYNRAVVVNGVAESLQRQIATAANASGGWPYVAGKASRIEPTCWALLALQEGETADRGSPPLAPHLAWLAQRQRQDGLLVDQDGAPPNFTANGLAACTLSQLGRRDASTLSRVIAALVAVKGVAVDDHDPRQDNTLQGWPWMPDTFSWLEPTAWCLLALKKAADGAADAARRISDAERLIANRVCEGGGWNFGNASAVGQDLRPYVPTTALALIALQNRKGTPAVDRSIAWLSASRLKEPTAMALALAAIALRIHGVDTTDVEGLLQTDRDRAVSVGNVQALAMMLYALTNPARPGGAFVL